jgi:hypothetical protein
METSFEILVAEKCGTKYLLTDFGPMSKDFMACLRSLKRYL